MAAAIALTISKASADDGIKAVQFSATASSSDQYFSITMDNSQPVWAYQFSLSLPEGITIDESREMQFNDTRYPKTVGGAYEHKYVCDKQANGSWTIIVYTDKTNRLSGSSGEILKVPYQTTAGLSAGAYQATISNQALTVTSKNTIYPEDSASPDTKPGDANGDGVVSVTDAVCIISYILGENPSPFVLENADVNGDSSVTVTDAVQVVSMIVNP